MENIKIVLTHIAIGGIAIPFALSLIVSLLLYFMLPFIGFLAYIMFPLIFIFPIVCIGVGVKYSSIYLSKKYTISDPGRIIKLSTIYYAIILLSISIVTYIIRSIEILGIGIILVPTFYFFTKKYFAPCRR